jgi:hypothetical protein
LASGLGLGLQINLQICGFYEGLIAKNPQKELKDISDYFNLTLVEESKTFVQEHASAKWNEKIGLVFKSLTVF